MMLMGPIEWLLKRNGIMDYNGRFADPDALPAVAEGLTARIETAVREFPCEILFIHRDAERIPLIDRQKEIKKALASIRTPPRSVCVVPVRMTEAWFLFDEHAIRRASGNPNGKTVLGLDILKTPESLNAKKVLQETLVKATELSGRRLAHWQRNQAQSKFRVRDYITDYSPLETMPSFKAFAAELQNVLSSSI